MREESHPLFPKVLVAVLLFVAVLLIFWRLDTYEFDKYSDTPHPSADRQESSLQPFDYEENSNSQTDKFRPREYIRIKDKAN